LVNTTTDSIKWVVGTTTKQNHGGGEKRRMAKFLKKEKVWDKHRSQGWDASLILEDFCLYERSDTKPRPFGKGGRPGKREKEVGKKAGGADR